MEVASKSKVGVCYPGGGERASVAFSLACPPNPTPACSSDTAAPTWRDTITQRELAEI